MNLIVISSFYLQRAQTTQSRVCFSVIKNKLANTNRDKDRKKKYCIFLANGILI